MNTNLSTLKEKINTKIQRLKKNFTDVKFSKMIGELESLEKTMGELLLLEASVDNLNVISGFYMHVYNTVKNIQKKIWNELKSNLTDFELWTYKMNVMNKEKKSSKKNIPLIDDISLSKKTLQNSNVIEIGNLKDIEFDSLSKSYDELRNCSLMIFEHLDHHKKYNISLDIIRQIIQEISNGYNAVAYHNFTHGFFVFQIFFATIETTNLRNYITEFEEFFGLIAALGHDLDHRGVNNAFYTAKKDTLAMQHYDNGVLENLHTASLFKILNSEKIKLFDYIKPANLKNEIKQFMISVILATDMAKHGRILSKLIKRIDATLKAKETESNCEGIFSKKDADSRRFLTKSIVHAIDIGGPCIDSRNYLNWAILVTQEFNDQVLNIIDILY